MRKDLDFVLLLVCVEREGKGLGTLFNSPQPKTRMSSQPKIEWLSVDPRNGATVAYDTFTTAILENAFQNNNAEVKLSLGGTPFLVKFSDMRQYNNSGGSRQVIRKGPPAKLTDLATVALTPALMANALKLVDCVDAAVLELEKDEKSRGHATVNPVQDPEPLVKVYDAIIAALYQERYRSKYGFDSGDAGLVNVKFGQSVPAYFANVSNGQSIFHRKMLSLLGLRNLAKYGFEIFGEMKTALFSGCPEDYTDKTGPNKMKYYTGNVVDLDTCVLRCHDAQTLAAVNTVAAKEGLPPFPDGAALANSPFGRIMAITQARTMIDDFSARFKLTKDEQKRRRINMENISPESIYVASSNGDRGKVAVWVYTNVGVLTFHANVPVMADVYGALLKSPYHLAKAFILVQQQSTTPQQLEAALDDFFENAVSDSCFNGKWKAIEAFLGDREQLGTIDDFISKLQVSRQKEFLALYDDDDDDATATAKELELMLRLAVGAVAIDPISKKTRPISERDVVAWQKKAMSASVSK